LITTFYLFSPFLSLVSEKKASWLLKQEYKAKTNYGMLLTCLVRKPI